MTEGLKRKLCVWCFIELVEANSFSDAVCRHCHELLSGTGMTDEHIIRLGEFALSRRESKE